LDPRHRFSDTVEDYRRTRPGYPEPLFDWLAPTLDLAPGASVVDVGCGTGISSRALAARGYSVIGVDPNPAMLAAARADGGDITYVESDAERLAVPVARCDAIVGAQSFHWIDLDLHAPARRRFRQLLGPGRRVAAFWNLRLPGDRFMDAYEGLLHTWSDEYRAVGAEHRLDRIRAQVDPVETQFPHHQHLDRAGFRGRVWSSSYVKNVVRDGEAFDAALDALFDRYARDGRVRFVYRTVAIAFEP
jgi:SAM-dependent methyltransferase